MIEVGIEETIELNGVVYKSELFGGLKQCESCDLIRDSNDCHLVQCLSHWGIRLIFKKV